MAIKNFIVKNKKKSIMLILLTIFNNVNLYRKVYA